MNPAGTICGLGSVSGVTDLGGAIVNPARAKHAQESIMFKLDRLDAINADRLYRKLGRACRESLARRRDRLRCRVLLHLHKVLLRSQTPHG